jgi:hypothetical protein
MFRNPPSPCVPITISATFRLRAVCRIASAGSPTVTSIRTGDACRTPSGNVASTNSRNAGSASSRARSTPRRIPAAWASSGSTTDRAVRSAPRHCAIADAHRRACRDCSEKSRDTISSVRSAWPPLPGTHVLETNRSMFHCCHNRPHRPMFCDTRRHRCHIPAWFPVFRSAASHALH